MIIVKIGQGRGKVGKASRNLPWDLANQKKKSSRSFPLFLSFQFCFLKETTGLLELETYYIITITILHIIHLLAHLITSCNWNYLCSI